MPPSHETSYLASLIQKCTSITTLKKARQLHAFLLTISSTSLHFPSPFVHNNLVSMYSRCNSLVDAKKVFDKTPSRNVVSYNALISAYSRDPNHANLAFRLIPKMGFECLRPNGATFTSLLQAASLVEDKLIGSLLHALVVKYGFLGDVCVQTSLLGMYSNCGDLESANEVFGCIDDKDVVAWNSTIFGNLRNDKIKEGLNLFFDMLKCGVFPTSFTYSMVLNACGRMGNYGCGKVIHAQVVVSNIVVDLPLQNALLDMYCNCGDIEMGLNVFSRIENPDLVSWNSMMAGLAEHGDRMKAIELFIQLKALSFPKPDEYTFAAVISATSALLACDYGKPLHGQITRSGLESSVFVGTTLVSMYFKNGDSESAQTIFSMILKKDVVLWTEMIMGYSRMADGDSAIRLFVEMRQTGHKIDSFVLSGALSACADIAMLKQGEMIHSQAIKTGYDVEMSVCGSLIDMYAKNGNLQVAQAIFSLVPNPDLKCWNAMLGAYSLHGMAEDALKLFEEILKHELRPDQVTFLSLLSACSHGGLVDRGKFLWGYMKENGCTAGPKHYSCMVSLLCRAGLLDEAEKIIIESPYSEEHLELWRTLLSSCVTYRNLEKGVHAAKQVLLLNSRDSGTHILLSNLYAATERWEGVTVMRRKIRDFTLEKDPGLSWIEDKNNIHVFSSGDQLHPLVNDAQAELHRLQGNMIKSVTNDFVSSI
ncbi:pentatricopeptide repeat-containing protein At3g50420 isoform X1 [Durio zibethinus]|uniref:Pentatricopeptide repeat-containing protein At3g50420 isoform X1 n=1 Tax=Durio zibethinus TaxID=66656 RepID=A0A6P6BDS6_DURZI|nr:pentatricopeptide repeat-containing protein At3g50420 isoform X1 [Durio zibethinus]